MMGVAGLGVRFIPGKGNSTKALWAGVCFTHSTDRCVFETGRQVQR